MLGYDGIIAATVAAALYERLGTRPNGAQSDRKERKESNHPHEVFARALQTAVETSLTPALANCRAYFRNGCSADPKELRSRLEEWDRLSACPVQRLAGPKWFLKHTESSIYLDPVRSRSRKPKGRRTLSVQLQIDVAENPIGEYLCFPDHVIEELVFEMKKRIEGWRQPFLSDITESATTSINVDYKLFPHRRGKAKLEVFIGLKKEPSRSDQFWTDLSAALETWIEETKRDDLRRKARRENEIDVPSDRWARTLAKAWLNEIWEETSARIHWWYGWPVCIRSFTYQLSEIAKVRVENDEDWSVLNPKIQNLQNIALQIVREGVRKALRSPKESEKWDGRDRNSDGRFPCVHFGNLTTVDRKEIESYRSIRNLIGEYIGKPANAPPLSLAVFGPPGSGKSYGVREIAKSLSSNQQPVRDETFNLSQFTSVRDLANALTQVRDIALEGSVPLIFLDEFDATFDHEPLGWLKHFLSLMQDGKYRSEAGETSIGRAILVFAGGTSKRYRDFTRNDASEIEKEKFRIAKGPDFVSRLRGFVDIIGPDRRPGTNDEVYIVRRAIMLRGLLEKKYKHLLRARDGSSDPLDEGLARALLTVSGYEHGTRSLEAILEMSALAKAQRFEKSALPPREQLSMHLAFDPKRPNEFFDLLDSRDPNESLA